MTEPSNLDLTSAPPNGVELVALLNSHLGELETKMGILVTEASPQRVVGTMPVEGNRQPYGLLHGGASVVLAETIGSLGAAVTAGVDRMAVGVEINATHHRSATSGTVTAIATRVHAGRSLITFEVRVVDDRDRPVCSCRLTCMVLAGRPGSA